MSKLLFNGNNFYEIKEDIITFWGLNFNEPFSIKINNQIRKYIIKNCFHINEVCEFVDDQDYELLMLCLKYRDDFNPNDDRVFLRNRLIAIGVKKGLATIIALDAGSSQVVVSKDYVSALDLKHDVKKKVINELFNFYMGY